MMVKYYVYSVCKHIQAGLLLKVHFATERDDYEYSFSTMLTQKALVNINQHIFVRVLDDWQSRLPFVKSLNARLNYIFAWQHLIGTATDRIEAIWIRGVLLERISLIKNNDKNDSLLPEVGHG